VPGLTIDLESVQTDIVNVDVAKLGISAAAFAAHLDARGVRGLPGQGTIIRFVTYRGVTRRDVERAAVMIREVAEARPWARAEQQA
jgi:threonine aldolase